MFILITHFVLVCLVLVVDSTHHIDVVVPFIGNSAVPARLVEEGKRGETMLVLFLARMKISLRSKYMLWGRRERGRTKKIWHWTDVGGGR